MNTDNWAKYKALNGKSLKAIEYSKGMEDGICQMHNKPYFMEEGRKVYIIEPCYLFKIEGDNRIYPANKEMFLKNVYYIYKCNRCGQELYSKNPNDKILCYNTAENRTSGLCLENITN